MTDARRSSRLPIAQALTALYIDFEGEKDRAPVLLGIHRRGRRPEPSVHHKILDERFALLDEPAISLNDAVENVVRRAEHGDRRIVAWSHHELSVVRALKEADPELVERFELRHCNALLFAKYWRNKLYGGDKPATGKLADYLAIVGWDVPQEAEAGHVADTVRAIRLRAERGCPPTDLQRERWRCVIEHNRHDCAGMRRVCVSAARELEATSAQ